MPEHGAISPLPQADLACIQEKEKVAQKCVEHHDQDDDVRFGRHRGRSAARDCHDNARVLEPSDVSEESRSPLRKRWANRSRGATLEQPCQHGAKSRTHG
jgi:hypothetical protein